jgi:hypothetical protein
VTRQLLLTISFIALAPTTMSAWLYPEHRDITLLALEMLKPEQRSALNELWSEARVGHEKTLCAQIADTTQALSPSCLDYGAWPALGGDHSCSARELLDEVLEAPWVLKVAAVGAQLDVKLAAAKRRDQITNAVLRSNIDLLRADPDMVARALTNNAHFLLARPNIDMTPEAYAGIVVGTEAEISAVGAYTFYHLRALAAAARIAKGDLTPEVRRQAALAAFADEGFALHFLEDGFASGHVAGNWGNSAVRMGTHDYYSQHGVEIRTWDGNTFVGLGDAYLKPDNAKHVAHVVRDSLAEIADVLAGRLQVPLPADNSASVAPESFNVCRETHFSSAVINQQDVQIVLPIMKETVIPGLGDVPGQLPRFRSELGPFLGVSAVVLGQATAGGFGPGQSGASGNAGLETAFRVGLGLEGVLDESGDGLVFADVGYRQNGPAQGTATTPGRGAVTLRIRAPFWLIPGDLVVAAPILTLVSHRTLEKMAVQAGNGGLIPWQSGLATRIGRFQFVLGREVGVSWYRLNTNNAMVLPTPGVPPVNETLVAVRSLQVEFPFLEYRPFRSFSRDQASSILLQFFGGFDRPTQSSVVSPAGAPMPTLHTIAVGGVRFVFDWRHYVN